MPLLDDWDFSDPGALFACNTSCPISGPSPTDMFLSPETLPPGEGPSLFCVPGNAGKSSELIVNSLDSDVGCFTIPTIIININIKIKCEICVCVYDNFNWYFIIDINIIKYI